MKKTPILLHSKAHSKNVLYPKNVPYTLMCKTATDNYKYSRASVMSGLKTRLVPRQNDRPENAVVHGVGRLSQGELGTLVWMILR